MIYTAEQIIARLSNLAPDTRISVEYFTPTDFNGEFFPIEEHWNEIVDIIEKSSSEEYNRIWDNFADAKLDVLGGYLCEGCDTYDYTTDYTEMGNYCKYCVELDNEDNN